MRATFLLFPPATSFCSSRGCRAWMVCVCVCTYIHIHKNIHMHAQIYTYVYIYTHVYTYRLTYTYTHSYKHTLMYTDTHTYIYTDTYIPADDSQQFVRHCSPHLSLKNLSWAVIVFKSLLSLFTFPQVPSN